MALDLSAASAFAESLMTDTCVVMRQAQPGEARDSDWNEERGEYVPQRVPRRKVYEGKCMVYNKKGASRPGEQGGQQTAEVMFYASLPVDSPEFLPEDEVTITVSADPTLVGRTYFIAGMDQGTIMATREIEMYSRVPKVN